MKMTKEELDAAYVLIDLALKEDVGEGDITTDSLIPKSLQNSAILVAKSDGVLAGLDVVRLVFLKLDENIKFKPVKSDGDLLTKGDIIAEFTGSYRALLTGERTALNFLQRMSGIATASHNYSMILKDFHTKILDTRKTLPGFRLLDKYSVRTGGSKNHRIGLYDMVMIKDNHIRIAGGIGSAVAAVRKKIPGSMKIEVETTNMEEVAEALQSGADIIMLDNMDNRTTLEAVNLIGNRAFTEASGNMSLERIIEVAGTGVDFISVGAITHSVRALDISMEILY